MSDHIAAVNRLTTVWLERATDDSGVLSGAGLWPLLAILTSAADEPGRAELADACGLPPEESMAAAQTVLSTMAAADGVDAALGFWAQRAARVRPEWKGELPPGTFGELSGDAAQDQPMLDAWASERTHGLIEHFPVESGPQLMLTLATALALKTTWVRRFSDEPLVPDTGAWSGRQIGGLKRTTTDLDDLRVADTRNGPLTLTRVEGDNGLDVYLALGWAGESPAHVLPNAVRALSGDIGDARPGSDLLTAGQARDLGPGVAVVPATRVGLSLTTTRFTVRSEHDLLRNADAFGLSTVSQQDKGHFSRVSEIPLRVDQARQSAVAIFSALGFEAAAVTAIGLRAVSMPVYNARGLAVTYDRPFGFVAVHRATGLVLFAGWVKSPDSIGAAKP